MKNIFPKLSISIFTIFLLSIFGLAQTSSNADKSQPWPVFDVHWHPPGKAILPVTLEAMKALNVKYG